MMVTVKYFGELSDITSNSQEAVVLVTSNLDDLIKNLFLRYKNLEQMKFSTAVNMKMVSRNVTIQDGDEISLFPPFAGG